MPQPDAERIREFIAAAKNGGASDEFLFRLLREEGWPERHIFEAFREYYESKSGVALPIRAGTAGAKDAFYLLLCFATLTTWAIAAGSLLFSSIDYYFPDPLFAQNLSAYSRYANSDSLAAVIVAFPVFLFVMWMITRDSRQHPAKVESGIRKWLTYIALLFAACTVIGDVVTFVAYLLRGELTVRFTLKVVTVLVIASGIFGYYQSFARKQSDEGAGADQRNLVYAAGAVALTALALLLGFVRLGSPNTQRMVEADEKRVNALRTISVNLNYRNELPPSLAVLEQSGAAIHDPVTRQPYTYRRKSDTQYDLCANFDSDNRNANDGDANTFWHHPRGFYCFSLETTRPNFLGGQRR